MTADRRELDYAIAALLQALESHFYPKPMQTRKPNREEVRILYERVKAETVVYSQKLLQEQPTKETIL